MKKTKVSDFLDIGDITQYKLHLATYNGINHPLSEYERNWNVWVSWNEWKGWKNDFSRPFIFSMIKMHNEKDKWLFAGIFKIDEQLQDSYKIILQDKHKQLIGRLVIEYHRYRGLRGRAFNLENQYSSFIVSEVLENVYGGVIIP